MSVWVGIDPGLEGAIATIDQEGNPVDVCDTPVIAVEGHRARHEFSTSLMASILRETHAKWIVQGVVLEKVGAMPKQGVASTFGFGRGVGMWEGIIAALGLRLYRVTPQRWQKRMMPDMERGKDSSRVRALQLWPGLTESLKLKKHHGRADALLLAEYGRTAL